MKTPKPESSTETWEKSNAAEGRKGDARSTTSMKTVGNKPAKGGARKARRCAYSNEELHELFYRFSIARPEPKGELEHVNPYTLLVAVALSAQATDVGVNRATRSLFAIADTPEKMLALGEEQLIGHIKTIGLYRNKAKNVIALSEILLRDHGGEVPRTREELVKLPGVGRKTANVVLSMAFGIPTMAVDTHVFRLGNRMKLALGKTPDEVEEILMKVIPDQYLFHAHHWLILHGRYCCKARKPECENCIVADLCKFDGKTNTIPAPLVLQPQDIT